MKTIERSAIFNDISCSMSDYFRSFSEHIPLFDYAMIDFMRGYISVTVLSQKEIMNGSRNSYTNTKA